MNKQIKVLSLIACLAVAGMFPAISNAAAQKVIVGKECTTWLLAHPQADVKVIPPTICSGLLAVLPKPQLRDVVGAADASKAPVSYRVVPVLQTGASQNKNEWQTRTIGGCMYIIMSDGSPQFQTCE